MAVPSPLSRRPTVAAVLVLTAVTGLIDTFSYLTLGHVFVAFMTGNIVFLGVGLQPSARMSAVPSVIAVSGFVLGSLTGGRIATRLSRRPRRWLVTALAAEAVLLALVALVSGSAQADGLCAHVSIALLALAAGLQNSTVRHFGVPDLNASVLTSTLTGLTADSALGGGQGAKAHRRAGSIAAMLGGAAVAAALLHISATAVIVLAAVLVALVAGAFATGRRSAASGADVVAAAGEGGGAFFASEEAALAPPTGASRPAPKPMTAPLPLAAAKSLKSLKSKQPSR